MTSSRSLFSAGAALSLLFLAALTGCATVARGVGKATGNKFADPRSGSVWVVPPPQLEPPSPAMRKAYISFRNLSDVPEIELGERLKSAAERQGWQLVDDPTVAEYRLRVQARFFGEVQPESGGAQIGRGLGWIAGAAVGLATYELTDSALGGVAAGGASGYLFEEGLKNASAPREYALILDVLLEERSEMPVEFEVFTESGTQAGTTAGVSGARSGEHGSTTSASGRKATSKQTSDYYPHGARLSVWANRMAMKEEEATPLILERLEHVMEQLLPM